MGRVATNTLSQIEKLTDRGLLMDYDDQKVNEILLDIGYYRLGFYWCPFETDDNHKFIGNVKFSDVIKLYYLDTDLRNILTKSINRIEINFRTKLVYYVSNKFKNSPTWFADPSIIKSEFIDKLDKFYNNKFINSNKAIKAHHQKYINDKYAPAWKTLEFFTFGTVLNIYRNIKDEDIKKRISEEFGILNYLKFINLIETVVLIRNICAHGDVLFDLRTPRGISIIPALNFNNNDRSSLDSCIKVISYFLGQISINRQLEMNSYINELFNNYKDNVNLKRIITDKINYKYE